ncbi:MAG: hypothetical protein OXC95_12885, partial [Dehalococcoidia bacterium]|nr:hypothetical protein [Dehalococcoidia bacterium]
RRRLGFFPCPFGCGPIEAADVKQVIYVGVATSHARLGVAPLKPTHHIVIMCPFNNFPCPFWVWPH